MYHLLPGYEGSQSRSLDLGRLLAVQQADEADEFCADLVANLVRARGVKDEREHLEELVELRVEEGGLRLE